MSNSLRLSQENSFIEHNRLDILYFAGEQYKQLSEKGIVTVTVNVDGDFSSELRYMTVSLLQDNKLIGNEQSSSIEQSISQALEIYNPEEQIVLMFLYEKQVSVYALSKQDLSS